ncbi:EpsG family protein [Vibrio breoganii]
MYFLIFFIPPVFLLIISQFVDDKFSKLFLIFIFVFCWGVTFPFSNDKLDAYYYMKSLEGFRELSFSDFYNFHIRNYLATEQTLDIYYPITSFILAKLNASGQIQFTFYLLVMFFLQVKTYLLLKQNTVNSKYLYFVFVLLFLLSMPLVNVSTVRFFTAAWLFVVGTIGYCINQKKRYIVILFLTPLCHFSFIGVFLLPIVVLNYIRLHQRSMIVALFVAFILGVSHQVIIEGFSFLFSDFGIGMKMARYTNEEYMREVQINNSEQNIIKILASTLWFYSTALSFFVISCHANIYQHNKLTYNLWLITGVMLIVSLLTINITSLARFSDVFTVLFFCYIAIGFSKNDLVELSQPLYKVIAMFILIVALFRAIFVLRLGLDVLGYQILLPVPLILIEDNFSLLCLVKGC